MPILRGHVKFGWSGKEVRIFPNLFFSVLKIIYLFCALEEKNECLVKVMKFDIIWLWEDIGNDRIFYFHAI